MYYLTSLMICGLVTVVATSIGMSLARLMPQRYEPIARFYFSPILGLAVMILFATLIGWFSPFHKIYFWIIAGAAAVLLYREVKRGTQALGLVATHAIFIMIGVSGSILVPILLYGEFNSFNDAFTYLVHGQWLQSHAFSVPAIKSGSYPALTQVALYQQNGHRMGGSFFLALLQAGFGIQWSYYVYPAALSIPLAYGALATAGVVALLSPARKSLLLFMAAMICIMPNGMVFGAMIGFFPQTFGLAFSIAVVGLWGMALDNAIRRSPGQDLRISLLVSILGAGLVFAYNDIFPFIGLACGTAWAVLMVKHAEFRSRGVKLLAINVSLLLVLVNLEWIRVVRNFVDTLLSVNSGAAIIGWPILWTPIEFLGFSLGLRSGFQSPWDWQLGSWIYAGVILAITAACLWVVFRKVSRKNSAIIMPIICAALVFIAVFIKFRYFAVGSTPQEIGATFLQFKCSKYASLFLTALFLASAVYFYQNFKLKNIAPPIVFLFALLVLFHNVKAEKMFTGDFQRQIGGANAFDTLRDLREVVNDNVEKNDAIYLNLQGAQHKIRQIVAYILYDHPLAGDYRDDGYLTGYIPENERVMPLNAAGYVIGLRQKGAGAEIDLGNLGLWKNRGFTIDLMNVENGYGRESNDKGDWWFWTGKNITFDYNLRGTPPKSIKIGFTYMTAIENAQITMEVKSLNGVQEFKLPIHGGWVPYQTKAIKVAGNKLTISFRSTADGIQKGADPRALSFLVQNLAVQPDE